MLPCPQGKTGQEASFRKTYRDIPKVLPSLYTQKQDQPTHMLRPSNATGLKPLELAPNTNCPQIPLRTIRRYRVATDKKKNSSCRKKCIITIYLIILASIPFVYIFMLLILHRSQYYSDKLLVIQTKKFLKRYIF